jgi:hypothetical protein
MAEHFETTSVSETTRKQPHHPKPKTEEAMETIG